MTNTANAQVAVYNSYADSIISEQYRNIDGINTVLNNQNFVTPLSYYQGGPVTDFDNGVYFNLPIGFPFVFNGFPYTTVNVCVNGWVNFSTVPYSTNNQLTLFSQNLPNACIAPFFGDHYLRPDATQGFVPSNISYALTGQSPNQVLTIQWENLNVNYLTATFPKQSVATFQLKLYQSGLIEFAYGAISSGYVQTGGCTVGIKDQNGTSRMNGLFVTESDPFDSVIYSMQTTTLWPPSREPGQVIRFTPFGNEINGWGDGDVNLLQAPGEPQNLFVTTGDALTILRSVALNVPLDSVFGRAAFHGDVLHDGRYILINGVRSYDTTVPPNNDPQYLHPNDIVYFNADSYDASFILLYLAGRLPELPWVYDTVPPFGKSDINVPLAINFGDPLSGATKGLVTVPIMVQGSGAIGADFNINYGSNVQLVSIDPIKDEGSSNQMLVYSNKNKVAMALAGNYKTPTAVANATFKIEGANGNETVYTSNMSINRVFGKDISASLTPTTGLTNLSVYPNPFNTVSGAQIQYTTSTDGYVTVQIYDVLGNVVRSLVAGVQQHGLHEVAFDGRNDANNTLPSGIYYYRLNADGVTLTKQMSFVK